MKLEWKRIWNQLGVRSIFFLCIAVMLLLFVSEQIKKNQTDDTENQLQEEMSANKYHKEYQKKIAGIVEEAESMGEISIFAEKGSYVDRNRTKTKNDYGKLYQTEIIQGKNKLFQAIIGEKYWTIIVLIFGMFLVYKVPYTRDSSMGILTYSCEKGRKVLRKRHLLLVLMFSTGMAVILYLLNMGMGFLLCGADASWLRSIQSVEKCWSSTLKISMGGALVWNFVSGLLGVMAGICTGWALMKKFGMKLGLFLWALLYGAGYSNLQFVEQDSNLNLLRVLNFYKLLFSENIFTTYQNYNVAGYPVGETTLQLVCAMVVFAITGLYIIYKGNKEKSHRRFIKFKSVKFLKRRLAGIGCTECKEILWYQKGVWILAFAMLLVYVLSLQNQVSYTVPQKAMNEFYDNYSGQIKERTYQKVEDLKEEYIALLEKAQELKKSYGLGELTKEEYEAEKFFMNRETERAGIAIELNMKMERLKKLQQQGYQVELVNERGYEKLLQKGFKRKSEVAVQILVVCLLLMGYFRTFARKNWRYTVRATRDGRDLFFLKRLLIFLGIVAVSMGIIYGVDFYNVYQMYPMEQLNAPIKSIQLLENAGGNYPIWLYLAIVYLGKIALWCIIGTACYSAGYFAIMGKSFREAREKDEIGN